MIFFVLLNNLGTHAEVFQEYEFPKVSITSTTPFSS